MSERVRPFSSGTEYMMWTEYNCDTCAKDAEDCGIAHGLAVGSFTDGTISRRIANRAGFTDDTVDTFRCKEWQAPQEAEPAAAPSEAERMRAAGMPCLPGFE